MGGGEGAESRDSDELEKKKKKKRNEIELEWCVYFHTVFIKLGAFNKIRRE